MLKYESRPHMLSVILLEWMLDASQPTYTCYDKK